MFRRVKYKKMLVLIPLVIVIVYLIAQSIYTLLSFYNASKLVQNTYTGTFSVGDENKQVFKILVDGDSVGAGVGATSFKSSLAGRITDYYSKEYLVLLTNNSINGAKMNDLISKDVEEDFDLAIIIISSNDLFRFTNISEFEESTKKVIAKYSKSAKKVIFVGPGRVFDAAAIPFFIKPFYFFAAPKYSNIITNISNEYKNTSHASLINTDISVSNYGNTLANDNFHPNDYGVEYWFDILKPHLDSKLQ